MIKRPWAENNIKGSPIVSYVFNTAEKSLICSGIELRAGSYNFCATGVVLNPL